MVPSSLPASLAAFIAWGCGGPFALLASASDERRKASVPLAVAYSVGRFGTYLIVGILFGFLGMLASQSASAATGHSFSAIQQVATYMAGGLMVVVGLVSIAHQLGWKQKLPSFGGYFQKFLQRQIKWVQAQPPVRKALAIGALTCLMPCGWLYTFAIVAAGTASPVWGGVVMASFWAGTVPILFALMLGYGRLGNSIQRRVPMTMAVIIVLTGTFTIFYRAPVVIGGESLRAASSGQLVEQVKQIDHEELPCCSEE